MATKTAVRRIYIRSKKRSRRAKFTFPLAVIGGFVPMAAGIWNRRANISEMGKYTSSALTGYYPGQGWNIANMKEGALPIALGIIIHKIAGRLGVNRAIARTGLPFIRI